MSLRNPRQLGVWGEDGTRVLAADSYWKQPMTWLRDATRYPDECTRCGARLCMVAQNQIGTVRCPSRRNKDGEFDPSAPPCDGEVALNVRPRVFAYSLGDVFEVPEKPENASVCDEARRRLWPLIESTSGAGAALWRGVPGAAKMPANAGGLDWMLLTKRIEHVMQLIPASWAHRLPFNVWMGTSVENQAAADFRIPHLLHIPAAVRFLSMEPLLGPVRIPEEWLRHIDLLILGGESGAKTKARTCQLAWIDNLIEQGRAAGCKVFVKQLGRNPAESRDRLSTWPAGTRIWQRIPGEAFHVMDLKHDKGGDPEEWPERLRIREMPTPKVAA